MDEPRDLNFFFKDDTCLGVFQNLDQGPDGVLKLFLLNVARALELEP